MILNMKLVVAVSGGVDSVVLLDMLMKNRLNLHVALSDQTEIIDDTEIIVAHFDHGMREESACDARFIEGVAKSYGVGFVSKREELAGANEAMARSRRYDFLFSVKSEQRANLVTAHHLDDLVETIALNLLRGSRWRGLATMSNQKIIRPLTGRTKSELMQYALEHRLEWVEDETNSQDIYKRNKIRKQLAPLPEASKQKIYGLWLAQNQLRGSIGQVIAKRHFAVFDRYFMIMIDPAVAHELIYSYMLSEHNASLLGHQLDLALHAIKVGRPSTKWQIGQSITMIIDKSKWYVQDKA